MTTYSKIYEYLDATPGKRAHILPTAGGGWYLGGPNSHLSGISGPLQVLLSGQVPAGTKVINMWLELFNGKMKFSYSASTGSLFAIDLIPGHFEEELS